MNRSSVRCSITIIAMLLAAGCAKDPPEQPGDRSNPKLSQLIQQAINKEIASMNPTWAPGLRAGANLTASSWLNQIAEAVSGCTGSSRDLSKHNKLVYQIKLQSGETITGIYSGLLCQYQQGFGKPLVMKVTFKDGVVQNVHTDGREFEEPVSYAKGFVSNFAEKILLEDRRRRPTFYYKQSPTQGEIKREWR
jgi:hypothetical protein